MFHQSRGSSGTNQMIQKLDPAGVSYRNQVKMKMQKTTMKNETCRLSTYSFWPWHWWHWWLGTSHISNGRVWNGSWTKYGEKSSKFSMEVLMEKSSTENIFQGFLLGLHGFSSKNPWLGKFNGWIFPPSWWHRRVYLCWMLGQGWQETVFRAGWNLE